jgi:hypothetical protein
MVPHTAAAIGVLRIRATASDPIALGRTVDRQLQGVDPTPAGLPPSALLIVRRLVDPLPGQLGRHGRLRAPPAWSDALRERLNAIGAAAERPRKGRVSATADAVLFTDAAELTACLVLDLVRGTAGQRWWWQRVGILRPEIPGAGALDGADAARILASVARDIPAIFARLVDWGAIAEVVGAMDQQQTRRLLDALATPHRLDERVVGPGEPMTDPMSLAVAQTEAGEPPVPADRNRAASAMPGRHGGASAATVEPWLRWLPAAVARDLSSKDQRCLVGLALMLYRKPAAARQASFVRQADAWWRNEARVGRLGVRAGELLGPAEARDADPVGAGTVAGGLDVSAGRTPQIGIDDPDSRATGSDGLPRGHTSAGTHANLSQASRTAAMAGLSNSLDAGPAQPLPLDLTSQTDPAPASTDAPTGLAGAEKATPAYGLRAAAAAGETAAPSAVLATSNDQRHPARGAADAASPPTARVGGRSSVGIRTATAGTTAASAAGMETRPPVPGASQQVFSGDQVPTRLGGVLYLIHALEALEIPAAFEADWQLASGIGSWGTLDLMARALLADGCATHARDPLWTVLAALTADGTVGASETAARIDSREGVSQAQRDAIGDNEPSAWPASPPDYRAPVRWRTALADAEPCIRWTEADGRLWLWSENGYLSASVHRDRRHALDQAQAETSAWAGASAWHLRPGRAADVPLAMRPASASGTGFGFWAAAAAPAVARRLRLALGDTPDAADPLHRLLSVPGVLYLSASHVDLVTDLNQIWLPARRAGLDRNPGWLPEYGRVVLFHYR